MVSLRRATIGYQVIYCTLVVMKSVQVRVDVQLVIIPYVSWQSLVVLQTLQELLRDALTASGSSADRAVLHTCCTEPQHCDPALGPASDAKSSQFDPCILSCWSVPSVAFPVWETLSIAPLCIALSCPDNSVPYYQLLVVWTMNLNVNARSQLAPAEFAESRAARDL